MAPRRAHELALVALAALSVAAALSLGRVFDGSRFVLPVVGAALLPHALSALLRGRRWSLPATLATSLVGMAAYAVWVVDPGATTYGLPTGATIDVVGGHLREGYEELRTASVPAPVSDGGLLLAVAAAWLTAQTADLLAFRRDSSVGAVAPALTLFIWTATLGTPELRTRTMIGFTTAAVVFLLCQHQALLEQRRAWFAGRGLGAGTGLVSAGALIGIVAVAGGALLGPALPGARSDALVDVKGLGDGNGSGGGGDSGGDRSYRTDPPLARIGENFVRRDRVEVFTVQSPVPEYWRIAALDRYSSDGGGQWTLTAQGADEVSEGVDETGRASDTVSQRFRIGRLGGRWMPAAYRAVAVEGANPLVVNASTTLVTTHDTVDGLEYAVRSQVPIRPSAATAPPDRPLPPRIEPYTELPDEFPAEVVELAEVVVAGADNPTERAAALEEFFHAPDEGFTYSLDADVALGPEAQSQSAIREFLFGERRGFCVQFAGSYAAMARGVGLPARVAVGYTPGVPDPDTDRFRVTTWDAHAWPEVWLGANTGWVRFEPTPASPDGPGGSALPPTRGNALGAGDDPATAVPTTQAVPPAPPASPSPPPAAGSEGPTADVSIDAPGDDGGRGVVGVGAVALAVAGALGTAAAVGAAVLVVVAKARRRARRRARRDPTDAIAGAWAEARDRLGEAGVTADPALTPFELADEAGERVPVTVTAPLHSLAATYTAARYGRAAPDAAAAVRAWAQVGEIDHALAGAVSVWVHWRRRLDPTALRHPTIEPATGPQP